MHPGGQQKKDGQSLAGGQLSSLHRELGAEWRSMQKASSEGRAASSLAWDTVQRPGQRRLWWQMILGLVSFQKQELLYAVAQLTVAFPT